MSFLTAHVKCFHFWGSHLWRNSEASLKLSLKVEILTLVFHQGLNATLTHKNGERYSGIFSSLSDKGYTIKMARKIPSSGKQSNGVTEEQVGEGPDRTLTLEVGDVIDCKVDGVRLDKSQGRAQNGERSRLKCHG